MAFLDNLKRLFSGDEVKDIDDPVGVTTAKDERQTTPAGYFKYVGMSSQPIIPRRGYERIDITDYEDDRFSVIQLITILSSINDEFGMAVWNTVMLGNTDYSITVHDKDNPAKINEEAQKALLKYIDTIQEDKGGLNAVITQFFMTVFLQGAVSSEVVPGDDFEIVPVNPYSVYFKLNKDKKPVPYTIDENGKEVLLDEDFFWYIPFMAMVDDPYGQSPVAPALSNVFFMGKLMYNLRRITEMQALPRIDIELLISQIKDSLPPATKNSPKKLKKYIDEKINEIKTTYQSIKADDAFIHTDNVKVNPSTDAGTKMFDIGTLFKVLERKIIRGLKQLPVFMGNNEGTTETHGTVQYQIYVNGIKGMQKTVAQLFEQMFELYLRYLGYQSKVKFDFEEVKATDELAEAQAEWQKIINNERKYMNGWIDNNEASINVTGSEPADSNLVPTETGSPTDAEDLMKKSIADSYIRKSVIPKGMPTLEDKFKKILRENFEKLSKLVKADTIIEKIWKKHPQEVQEVQEDVTRETSTIYWEALGDIQNEFRNNPEIQKLIKEMGENSKSFYVKMYELQSVLALSNLGFKNAKFKLTNPGIKQFLYDHSNDFPHSVFETTQRDIASEIYQGYKNNKTVDEVARNVKGRFGSMTTSRSRTIARTELGYARRIANKEMYTKMGVSKKAWLTGGPGRPNPRPEHDANEAQGEIPMSEPFQSGEDYAPSGINCGCDIKPKPQATDKIPKKSWTGD